MRTERELAVGVVGAGWAGREHCASLAQIGAARVVGVCDADPTAARTLAEALDARVCAGVEALLALQPLDALVVATPSGVHREAVVPALERGVAVFVEKPLARTLADAQAIADAAERAGSVCAVGYQWRAAEAVAAVAAALGDRRVALLLSQGVGITQARGWFGDERLSGGLMFERASHHIDLQRMLAGQVRAVGAMRGDIALAGIEPSRTPREDVLGLQLSFASGAVGAILVGWVPEDYPGTQSLRVFATGTAYDIELDPRFSARVQGELEPLAPTGEHPFVAQLRRFLHAARFGDPSMVACPARDAVGTVAVAAAAERALAEDAIVAPAIEATHAADPAGGGDR